MAMVKCPECEVERSDQAGSVCPKCGQKLPNTAAIFLKRYRWNIAVSGLFLLGMFMDKNGFFAKKSDPRTFTNFCLAGIACFWGASFMFWRLMPKKIPFNAKRKIARDRDKPWRGNPDYTFIGKVGAEATFMVNWVWFYQDTYFGAFVGLFFSIFLGWVLFMGGIAWTFGFDLNRLIDLEYVMVISNFISAYVVIKKKTV